MSAPYLELETIDGARPISGTGVLIGRADGCGVRLRSGAVSAKHARIIWDGAGWWITDEGSTNGTFVDGKMISQRTALSPGTVIELGPEKLQVLKIKGILGGVSDAGVANGRASGSGLRRARGTPRIGKSPDATIFLPMTFRRGTLKIGRDLSNDLVIDDRNVSRFHAELEMGSFGRVLRDLNSCNGTRVDGQSVHAAVLVSVGSEIRIGGARIVISESGIRGEPAAARLVARGIQQHVGNGECILYPTDLDILPGEFIAMIGETGSGKSTILKILAGETQPSAGSVEMDREDLSVQLASVGYVPQVEVLHRSLTACEAMRYGARLRLPPDTNASELDQTVDRVLRDFDMSEHGGKLIGAGLSGGQQRRVAIAMEMLGDPRMLFLDEPGSGLDVRLEGQLIAVLRRLTRRNCAVVTITHRTTFLGQFDRLLVMGRGGVLRFDGPPEMALKHFAVDAFDAIYEPLAKLQPPASSPAPREGATKKRLDLAVTCSRTGTSHPLGILTSRTARVLSRDRRNLIMLAVQAPVLAAGAALLFGREAFAVTSHNADKSAQLLFVLAIVVTWAGAIAGARALIGERAIFVRERAVGVRAVPYLMSKLLVLGAIGLVQSVLVAAVAFTISPLHSDVRTIVIVLLLFVLGTQVGLAMGLLLSALVATEEQAGSLLLFLLVPQVLFAGAIVAVKDMGALQPISSLVSTRWILAGAGSAMGLSSRSSVDKGFLNYYGAFFDVPWGISGMILLVMFCSLAVLAVWRLDTAWHG